MTPLTQFLNQSAKLFIKQAKVWLEILVNLETANKYAIFDERKAQVGFIAERSGGFFNTILRLLFKSHRPFDIDIFNHTGERLLHLSRKFFFFFSDLAVQTAEGRILGHVHRRFGILYKKYDLVDERGQVFARIASPRWRLWTFPIQDLNGETQGTIAKKWGGGLREIFTDADAFLVDFGPRQWGDAQKAVILAAAISVDFDFFEENQGAKSPLDVLDIG